jgi:imidazolonepropionase-like amidohydrolase
VKLTLGLLSKASLWLLVTLAACAPHKPAEQADESPAATGAAVVPDAPWRGEVSQAAGHEPRVSSPAVLLRGARLLIGDGSEIKRGHVLMKDGKIVSVGEGDGSAPTGAKVVDARGKVITPGLIDTHSHLGVYPTPATRAHADGNEMTTPVTPGVRAVDAFWPQDPGIHRALKGGVTTIQALPGSGNLIGGRGVTLKLRRATTSRGMHFEGAPDGLKMACGENPKRVYGFGRKQKPMTRMGNLAMQREAFMNARQLIRDWDEWRVAERDRLEKNRREDVAYQRDKTLNDACKAGKTKGCGKLREKHGDSLHAPIPVPYKNPPKRDIDHEALAAVLEGHVLVHIHCYRADDMANMIALADEAGFKIRSFHHGLEAYKIRKLLAEREISVSTWADWWGFKMEAYDGIQENLALVATAGGRAIVHSDSREGIRRLNQEASKGMWAGRHAGVDVSEAEAIKWVTINPAWALGVHERVGSLTVGKDADVVVWNKNPFSVYASTALVYVDGVAVHDASKPTEAWSDFEAAP